MGNASPQGAQDAFTGKIQRGIAMISDALHRSEELGLSSSVGIIAGLIAPGVMLAALDLTSRTVPAVREMTVK